MSDVAVKAVRLRAIEGAIKDGLGSITNLYREVVRDRLYEADGFGSAQEWAQQRIGGKWIALFPTEDRREIHAEMRAEGQSTRAIAEATGASRTTVVADVDQIGPPARTTGKDGKSYPATVARKPSTPKANAQVHKVLSSLSSFVIGVQQLIDGVTADADATEDELQTIDEAIKALRQLRRKLTA